MRSKYPSRRGLEGWPWRRLEPDGGWDIELPFQEWDYRVLCPLLSGDIAVFGDVNKYAPLGDRRIAHITSVPDGVCLDVLGVPGALVEVQGYTARRPAAVAVAVSTERRGLNEMKPAPSADERWLWDADSGGWLVRVRVGPAGHSQVRVRTSK